MGSMKQWMFGAAMAAGALGLGAAPAQAAQVGVYVGTPAAYVPPCPGPGYVWVAGYWADGYWVPGYWNYVGYGPRVVIRGGFGWDRGPAFYDRDHWRDRDGWRDRHDSDRHDHDGRRDHDNRFRR